MTPYLAACLRYCYKVLSLPSVKPQVIILTPRFFNLIGPKKVSTSILPFFSQPIFQEIERTFEVRIQRVSTNLAQIWRECCQIIWHQNRVSGFHFLRSIKSYDLLKKAKGCFFFKLQSLTECRKQTRPDEKILRHGFWDEGVKNSSRCSPYSPDHFRVERNRFCERCTFEKR